MAARGSELCCKAVPTAKPARRMAISNEAVAASCAAAPRPATSQKEARNCGCAPGVNAMATSANTAEKGRPNRNRTSVAPHGPVCGIRLRCSPLRATWNPDAITVAITQTNPTARRQSPQRAEKAMGCT